MSRRLPILFLTGLLSFQVTAAAAQGGPPGDRPAPPAMMTHPPTTGAEARPWHVRALVGLKDLDPDSAIALFDRAHFSAGYLGRTTREERLALLRRLREASAAASTIRVAEDAAGIHINLDDGNGPQIGFTIDAAAPFGIATIVIQAGTQPPPPGAGPALVWDGIASRIREAEAAGLSGQVLVRHQGKEVLRSSFGQADQAAHRKTAADAVYCIGSAPIDFTITAARLLAERGKLDLDAPIGRYLPGVPTDKASLTSRMIIEGKSGLANFHDMEEDWDPDLAWIDRATALRRILSKPLLSTPGGERQNSHSAFGLLAAIVEIVSGTSYPEFVRAEIFRPLGMTRTGFYGETLGLSVEAFAAGYGAKSSGLPNIAPNWGPTSWLVMGSGGMVSTLDDLRRYYDGMASGALFADRKPTSSRGMSVNGSDRGFFFTRMDNGQGDQVFLMSNTETSPALRPLVDGLAGLVMGRR